MLTWFKNAEAKTASTNFIWSYFVFPNSFVFPYFNSNILYSVHLFGIWWSFAIDLFANVLLQTFDYLKDFKELINPLKVKDTPV